MTMPAATTRVQQYPLLWLLLIGTICLAALIAIDQHYLATIFAVDRSYLCILILVIFFGASVHVGVHTFSVSRDLERAYACLNGNSPIAPVESEARRFGLLPQPLLDDFIAEVARAAGTDDLQHAKKQQTLEIYADRLRAPVELGWYIVDVLIRLGLLGTIIGFILIFASLSNGPQPDTQNIQALLLSMSSGMGTALYTTLLGLIAATLLGTQHMILGRSVEQLIASFIRLSQTGTSGGAQ